MSVCVNKSQSIFHFLLFISLILVVGCSSSSKNEQNSSFDLRCPLTESDTFFITLDTKRETMSVFFDLDEEVDYGLTVIYEPIKYIPTELDYTVILRFDRERFVRYIITNEVDISEEDFDRGLNGQMVLVLNKLSYKATLIGLYNDEITSQTSYDCELYQKLDD